MTNTLPLLYCASSLPTRQQYAKKLSQQFGFDLLEQLPLSFSYLLVLTDQHLELHHSDKKSKPIYIDFSSASYQYRIKQGRKNELIAKAVGIKRGEKPTIIDATAGWGEDGFVLANLGCKVTWLERSPVMAALLQDAVPPSSELKLYFTDAIVYLKNLSASKFPDVIYLDPMFPARQKSALVKQPMRILREIVGYDLDAAALLVLALQRAKKRVVVKRPRLAPAIEGRAPDWSIKGQSSRFDVYATSFFTEKD